MQDLFKKFIVMNKPRTTIDATNLRLFTHIIDYDNNYFREGDFIAINSVRVSDMFLADGCLIYQDSTTAAKTLLFNS